VSFRRVCETIRDNAFVTSTLPVIVSLEVHSSREQQEIMVEIMDECFKGLLVDFDRADGAKLPSPKDLSKKILIKVKYSPPTTSDEATQVAAGTLSKTQTQSSRSGDDEAVPPKDGAKAKPSKIIEALSRFGIYTKSYSFKSLDQPEAAIPAHVFSLSESALIEVHKENPADLFDHNKRFFMRAYPKGTRVSSSNLDPTLFWRKGVQMVALNWQKCDAGVMLSEGMFANTGGWVLKPENYRATAEYSDNGASHGSWFNIEFLAGQNIDPPKDVDAADFHPFIKCELHAVVPGKWEDKEDMFKAKTKAAKGRNPDFKRQVVKFEKIPCIEPELTFVR